MSQEPSSRRFCAACLLAPIRSLAILAVSSGPSAVIPGTGTGVSWLVSSTCGGRPGEMIKSLTPVAKVSIAEISVGVGITTLVAGAAATAGAATAVAAVAGAAAAAAAGVAGVPVDILPSSK